MMTSPGPASGPDCRHDIDYDGQPTRALLLRGSASIEVVDGVPQECLKASLKSQSVRGAEAFETTLPADT